MSRNSYALTEVPRAKAPNQTQASIARYGHFGTREYMRNIGNEGRDKLAAEYPGMVYSPRERRDVLNWASTIGTMGAEAIVQKYGRNGHQLLGRLGGDSAACKFWPESGACNRIADDYANLVANSNGLPPKHRNRASRSSASRAQPQLAYRARSGLKYEASRKSASYADNDWDWSSDNSYLYGDDANLGSLYGAERSTSPTKTKTKISLASPKARRSSLKL